MKIISNVKMSGGRSPRAEYLKTVEEYTDILMAKLDINKKFISGPLKDSVNLKNADPKVKEVYKQAEDILKREIDNPIYFNELACFSALNKVLEAKYGKLIKWGSNMKVLSNMEVKAARGYIKELEIDYDAGFYAKPNLAYKYLAGKADKLQDVIDDIEELSYADIGLQRGGGGVAPVFRDAIRSIQKIKDAIEVEMKNIKNFGGA